MEDDMKKCRKCGKEQSSEAFASHPSTPDGLQTWCKACRAKRLRDHRRDNPEYWREYNRRYKLKNRDRILAQRRKWYAANRESQLEKARAFQVKKRYGLALDEYDAILARGCAICGSHGPRMALDHDHANGKIRDALCTSCNNGLGRFHDDPKRLREAAEYIESHR